MYQKLAYNSHVHLSEEKFVTIGHQMLKVMGFVYSITFERCPA